MRTLHQLLEAHGGVMITKLNSELGDRMVLGAETVAFHLCCSFGRTPAAGCVAAFVRQSFLRTSTAAQLACSVGAALS